MKHLRRHRRRVSKVVPRFRDHMPSVPNRLILGAGAIAGILGGSAIAYWKPDGPLLGYWLSFALLLGLWISFTNSLDGLRQRAQLLVALNAIVVFFALL